MFPKRQVRSDMEALMLVVSHLIQQNHSSRRSDEEGCGYRGYNPDMFASEEEYLDYEAKNGYGSATQSACAVGCLISDSVYDISIEGLQANNGRIIEALGECHPNWVITEETGQMLLSTQAIHDRIPPAYWPAFFSIFTIEDFYNHKFPEFVSQAIASTNKMLIESVNGTKMFDDNGRILAGASLKTEYALVLREAFQSFLTDLNKLTY